MKAHYHTMNGRLVFEVDGDTPKAVFKAITILYDRRNDSVGLDKLETIAS